MRKQITQVFIVLTVVVWILFDALIYWKLGNAYTISATTWRYAFEMPSIPFIVGILIGHLFLERREPSTEVVQEPVWMTCLEYLILALSGIWLGLDINYEVRWGQVMEFSRLFHHVVWVPLFFGMTVGLIFFQMHEETKT